MNAAFRSQKYVTSANPDGLSPEGITNCANNSIGYIAKNLFGIDCTAKPAVGPPKELAPGVFGNTIHHDASGLDFLGRPPSDIEAFCDGVVRHDFSEYYDMPRLKGLQGISRRSNTTMNNAFKKIPNGSTGIVFLQGHFVNFEKSPQGKVTIIDCQSGKIKPLSAFRYNGFGSSNLVVDTIFDFSNATMKNDGLLILQEFINVI